MEPSRVWYQVNPPDPSNNFCAPSRKSTRALERFRWPLFWAHLPAHCEVYVKYRKYRHQPKLFDIRTGNGDAACQYCGKLLITAATNRNSSIKGNHFGPQ